MTKAKRPARTRHEAAVSRPAPAVTAGLALATAAIVAAILWAYRGVFASPFVFDDTLHILRNPRITNLTSLAVWGGTSRPLVQFSLAIDYALGGLDPFVYHATNVAIHAAAALALFALLRRVFARIPATAVGATGLATAGALMWALHPLQTEAVTYVIQRGESLMGLFYLFTLYAMVRSTESRVPARWQIAAVIGCVLGMASKPVMASAPFVALALDRVLVARDWAGLWRARGRMYAGLFASLVLLVPFLASADREWGESAGFGHWGGTVRGHVLSQPGVILHYVKLAFWPGRQAFDYGWPVVTAVGAALPALLAVGVLVALTIGLVVRRHPAGLALFAFFAMLAPTSSVIPVADLAVEHRMYLPLAALVALVAGLAVAAAHALSRRVPGFTSSRSAVLVALAVALSIALALATARRNEVYRSAVALWSDTVASRPNNSRAWDNLGLALGEAGRTDAAAAAFENAIRLTPGYADPYLNLGHLRSTAGRHEEALALFDRAVALAPEDPRAHYNYGTELFVLGRAADAVPHFEAATRLDPSLLEARNNLGAALYAAGRPVEAIPNFEAVLHLAPDPETRCNYGYALLRSGRMDDARRAFEMVLAEAPGHTRAQAGLVALDAR